jgi:coenzyme F420-reducing hydrogenase alpha subunit
VSVNLAGSISPFANYGTEKFLNRLIGKAEIQDALERLDMLTKEETGMAVARNLEVTHVVDQNVKTVEEVVRGIDNNVMVVEEVTNIIDKNVRAIRDGAKCSFHFMSISTDFRFIARNRNRPTKTSVVPSLFRPQSS